VRRQWGWVLFGAAVGTLYLVERLRPLRTRKEPGTARVGRNLTIGLLAGATTAASEWPIVAPVRRLVERRQLGLLRQLPLSRTARAILGFLLLDYTLYLWHRMNHYVPVLWRFHAVHHVDLDLDSTTGLRFHFGELALAAAFRAAQVLVLGVDDATLRTWQRLLVLSVVFHHSNLRLPIELERRLVRVLVTPRMHGIHHSVVREETDSNWSSGLTVWDRLHGTLRLDVPQVAIDIGVPAYREPSEVGLASMLALPFGEERPTWRLNGAGPEPARELPPGHPRQLTA